MSLSDEFFSVTVYLNYTGDNGGITLNPQKFRLFMPSMFGPAECSLVLTSIFDSCIKCTFQPTPFINRILELFSTPDHDNDSSHTKIQRSYQTRSLEDDRTSFEYLVENGTTIYIPHFGTQEDFWDVIRKFQNAILAGNDLFIASPPLPSNPSKHLTASLAFVRLFAETATTLFPSVQVMDHRHRSSIHHYRRVSLLPQVS